MNTNDKSLIIDRLTAALNALRAIPVYSEQDCLNKGGAMQFIRDAKELLENGYDLVKKTGDNENK